MIKDQIRKKYSNPTAVGSRREKAHGKHAGSQKGKKADDGKQKKTGDQRSATASYKVRSSASGIRVTRRCVGV